MNTLARHCAEAGVAPSELGQHLLDALLGAAGVAEDDVAVLTAYLPPAASVPPRSLDGSAAR